MSQPGSSPEREQLAEALLALRRLRTRVEALERPRTEPIAIVGIGCRFPGGADDPARFWRLLQGGVDTIGTVPPERWRTDGAGPGAAANAHGGFLKDIDSFDPQFFGIAPREAMAMDPQQRLVLEVAWEALEDAGQVPARLRESRTGVFVGIGLNDYGRIQVPAQDRDPSLIDTYTISGNALCITANRLSYLLDLRGPSLAVDTACSSSLVAVHLACQSVRSEECTLAIAGGVNLMLAPANTLGVAKFLSPDGRCKTFDARANGYVRGEGAGVVVLKPLVRAIADRDRIYAVIRGSAVNQDGFSSGLTVPNGAAQQALIRDALAAARVGPESIDYVEAHGTGTVLGDPIEANALHAVLSSGRAAGRPCAIGSVKTNIGHLEAAAGIAGLIKTVLALHHRQIPPSLHFQNPNPHIAFDEMCLRVQRELGPWPADGRPARAGVSSFGFGGTNAHVVLEQAPAAPAVEVGPRSELLVLSSHGAVPLRAAADDYAAFLRDRAAESVAAICCTAATRRTSHANRLAVVGRSAQNLAERLSAFVDGDPHAGTSAGEVPAERPRLAFVFSGQGSQWWGMGRGLLAQEPVFRQAVEACDARLSELGGWSLLEQFAADEGASRLTETEVAQPAIFATQVGLAALWRSWGIHPDAVVGHSVGEIAAAHVAGALTLEHALTVVHHRSRLMQAATGQGRMAAVELPGDQAAAAVAVYRDRLAVAAVNGPSSSVLSGDSDALAEVLQTLQRRGIASRMLPVPYAFHSPQMAPFGRELSARLAGLTPRSEAVTFVSTVTGDVLGPTALDGAYWGRNVTEPVLFAPAIEALLQRGVSVLLEIGPHPVLASDMRQCLQRRGTDGAVLASLRRGHDERAVMLAALGALWVKGQPVDWAALYPTSLPCVSLPRYRWNRRRYWIMTGPTPAAALDTASRPLTGGLLLRAPVRSPALSGTLFASRLSVAGLPMLGDHRVGGVAVLPAASYVEMVLTAAHTLAPHQRHRLDEVVIQRALTLPEPEGREVQLVLGDPDGPTRSFQLFSAEGGIGLGATSWITHASGRLVVEADPSSTTVTEDLDAIRARCLDEVTADDHYASVRARGLECGPSFRALTGLRCGDGEALGIVDTEEPSVVRAAGTPVSAPILDACIQVTGGAIPASLRSGLYLPLGFERLTVLGELASPLWSHARLRPLKDPTGDAVVADIRAFTSTGTLVLRIDGLALKRAGRPALAELASGERAPALYHVEWRQQIHAGQPAPAGGRWIVFADPTGVAMRLADRLQAAGHGVQRVVQGTCYERRAAGEVVVDLAQPEHFARLLADAWPCDGIVHAWSVGAAPLFGGSAATDALAATEAGCASLVHLLKAIDGAGGRPPRLWLVTRGAQPLGDAPPAMTQAPTWGLAAVIAAERPELRCVGVDLDPSDATDQAPLLFDELFASGAEDRVAFRGQSRYVARLVRRDADSPAPATGEQAAQPVQLAIGTPGVLDGLAYRPLTRRAPGPGEVEIRVACTGLNFRDVLNVLGMYPGDAGPLGSECAGTVEAVGEGVEALAVGDAVVAITTAGAFRSYVTVPAALAVGAPRGLSAAEAATIPIAFATARYALEHLAKLGAGERILIHAATGGVGLAAVQLAQRAGAEVFATAGSIAKREFLSRLGVRHVMDSRSLGFVEEIRAATGGAGVHVVLNSLSGEFIPAGLDVLGAGGRFVEIGKAGIWSAERVAEWRPDIRYATLYLGEVCEQAPALVHRMLEELVADVERGELRPLPVTVFLPSDATAAFRYMAQARHVGKIVVVQSEAPALTPGALLRPVASYLITGGLGGLGLKVARWMVSHGARHLVLMGRRGPSPTAQAELDEFERAGAHVVVVQGDVAREEDVQVALGRLDATMPALHGIVHAAGVLDDGLLGQQTWQRMAGVLAPKILGAWNLHRATASRPLDFFVMFSSIAPLIGSPGQAGYAAGNAFLDALAHARRRQGRVATTINWGPWAEVGMAAALADADRRRWVERGLSPMTPDAGVRWLQTVLEIGSTQAVVVDADWKRVAAGAPGGCSLLAEVAGPTPAVRDEATPQPAGHLTARLAAAPPTRRRKLLDTHVRDQVVRVLGLDASQPLAGTQGFRELGMDSLMAMELRNRLQASLARPLPSTVVFDHPNLDVLCEYLSDEILDGDGVPAGSGTARVPEPQLAIDQLSDDEAEALLLQELQMAQAERARRRNE